MNEPDRDTRYTGYVPGAIGRITTLHAVDYHTAWRLNRSFEIQVASELAAFLDRFDPASDGLWLAWGGGGGLAGSVAVDGSRSRSDGARLRWFIVAAAFRRRGIGRQLLERAVAFCERTGSKRLHLWTFQGLDAARALYEQAGFRLTQEHEVTQWGRHILEQRFDLRLGN